MSEFSRGTRSNWHGYTLDALRNLGLRAKSLTEGGEHYTAHVTYLEALDGLQALVGSTHPSTIEMLSSFVQFCLSQGYFEEAKDRMQKSLAEYESHFRERHLQTLHGMAGLEHYFKLVEKYGKAEILLIRAKIGLESVYRMDPEELYLNTYISRHFLASE